MIRKLTQRKGLVALTVLGAFLLLVDLILFGVGQIITAAVIKPSVGMHLITAASHLPKK
jgi:membrane-bound ClpP family serine protease